ncbi:MULTISPECIES: MFS transporter [Nonomuraea]|uniref:MFS transporter n=1 Tax=Nonomuraea ferruginea TaxID=46174 RepID=A0ABT4SVM9_9ACTN|nr:MFS transporter [Nonomuraea ferruginea]MDA0641234.1 MFS transporter [Nonomuraea ferruginea]
MINRHRRSITALFTATALMNAAMAAASAVSTLVATDRLGLAWAGVPVTAGIVGTGAGALALTRVMNRAGRRAGFVLGFAVATAGACLALVAVASYDIVTLTLGMLLLGVGNAGAQLSRYAAADLYPPARRGFAIGTVVWGGTLGAVGGPLLLAPSSTVATGLGWIAFTGPFLLAGVACAAAMAVSAALAGSGARPVPGRARLSDLVHGPAARSAFAVMAAAQVVMVGIMTAAPPDMHLHHHGLDAVGAALAAHTFGMFAFSPLTGHLIDRYGARPVMAAGLAIMALSVALAAAGPGRMPMLTAGLFLLGYGWNLCFIGGSAGLATGLPEGADRMRVEGAVDAGLWGAAAVAGLASTMVLSSGGYTVLAPVAMALLVLAAVTLARTRRAAPARR